MSHTTFNPNSAQKRIQNHLAYKLGLALIHYDKQRKGISKDNDLKELQRDTKDKTNTNTTTLSLNKESLKDSYCAGGGAFLSLIHSLFLHFYKTLLSQNFLPFCKAKNQESITNNFSTISTKA